jgi:hypothetical protein
MINEGDKLRVYDHNDWYDEGTVVLVSATEVDVDFDDWVQRYPVKGIRETWIMYQRVLVPLVPGSIVTDYRIKSSTSF